MQEEDTISIMATVERAIAAGVADNQDGATNDRPRPLESYTSRRTPKQFALAEVRMTERSFCVDFAIELLESYDPKKGNG